MRTTIDQAGRVVIPKPVREEAGLRAGMELEVEFRDGRLEIEPTATPMRVAKRTAGATIEADAEMPVLTGNQVRDTLDRIRR